MTLLGVLKRAALVAVVLVVVGCESTEKTDGPEPIERHLVYVGQGHGGPFPIDWSDDGSALLAGLAGNWGSEPIAVDPETGTARELGRFGRPWGSKTIALSRDGRSVLIQDGSFADVPPEKMTVLIVPYQGGKTALVVRGARTPSWNR